jgi:Skp family chaperone for outer membrane proteins
VAVVDIAQVLEQLSEKREREMQLESEIGERQDRLDRLKGQADLAKQDLEVLLRGTKEFRERQEEAIRLEGRLQIENEIAQRRLSQSRMRMQLELFNKILEAAQRYADREGFDIVLSSDVSDPIPEVAAEQMQPQEFMAMLASRRVVHASGAVDITDEVAQMMNNEFRAP